MKKSIGTKIAAGAMACTMAACLALTVGCGDKAKPSFVMPENGFDTSKTVEITFYHTMGKALRDQLDIELGYFNELYPNIKVNHKQVGGYDDVRNQITNEIQAGNQPNVAYCYPDHVALYNRSAAVQPLDDFLPGGAYADQKVTLSDGTETTLGLTTEEKDMFIKGFYDEGKNFGDEHMYTLPFAKSTEVLFYNKTFFEEHKDKIQVPTTWDEMEAVCKTIKEDIDPESIPLGYDSEANWFITMCEQQGTPYTAATGEKYLFDTPENHAFVERFTNWHQSGYVTTQLIYKSYTSGLFTATSGQRAYMCIGSSAGAKNQQAPKVDNDYAFEVGITRIPQVDVNNPKVISQGPSVCIFKSDDPQKVLASWLLVKYLATNVEFQAAFSNESGYLPPLTMEVMRTNQAYAESLDQADGFGNITSLSTLVCLEQANAYYTSPAFVGSSKARDEVGRLMQAALTKSKTIDQAFADAIEECEYFG